MMMMEVINYVIDLTVEKVFTLLKLTDGYHFVSAYTLGIDAERITY